jgi:MFS family permease
MSTAARSVFTSRAFTLFYAGQAFSYAGYGLRLVAIPLLVFHLTNSASALGATYSIELLPFAIFGLAGGSLADRVDRRTLMIVSDGIRFAVLATFALAFATKQLGLPLLFGGIALEATCAAVFVGAQASSITYLLGKERATQAIAALMATEQLAITVLPPLGGALFAIIGPLPALALNAATYLVSAGAVASVHGFGPDEPGRLPSTRELLGDVGAGFRFLWNDAALRTVASLGAAFNFFGFMTGAVFIPFLKRDFGASDLVVGYALGIGAIGAIVGSVAAGRSPRSWPFGRVMTIAYALDALAFVPVMLTHDLRVAVVFLTITNGCVMYEIAQMVGWRMRIAPELLVGRVSAAARLVALAGTVPGSILGGALADRYGARLPIVVSGIGYLAIAALVGAFPALRRERR